MSNAEKLAEGWDKIEFKTETKALALIAMSIGMLADEVHGLVQEFRIGMSNHFGYELDKSESPRLRAGRG